MKRPFQSSFSSLEMVFSMFSAVPCLQSGDCQVISLCLGTATLSRIRKHTLPANYLAVSSGLIKRQVVYSVHLKSA